MKKIEIEIVSITHSIAQSHNYAVLLSEVNGKRRLPVVIGGFEAQAIVVAQERLKPNRPLTHDLFKNTLTYFDINLKEVVINNLVDGIFYAVLVCEKEGELYEIDSRTSDALALAVRFDCPIFTYEFILDQAGIMLEELPEEEQEKEQQKAQPRKKGGRKKIENLTREELEKMLDEVLDKENYEKAASIRDELKRRNQNDS
ncbi:MAG TPA: bifunctional nuclease domain-containing protein [Saprospiraceae bacterium]|nr:bifunctional nuclease domain-containing protein [Saprospiraceae bacterium]